MYLTSRFYGSQFGDGDGELLCRSDERKSARSCKYLALRCIEIAMKMPGETRAFFYGTLLFSPCVPTGFVSNCFIGFWIHYLKKLVTMICPGLSIFVLLDTFLEKSTHKQKAPKSLKLKGFSWYAWPRPILDRVPRLAGRGNLQPTACPAQA